MPRWGLLMAPALFCLAMPAAAQDVAPVAVPEPAVVPTAAPVADSNVGPFYEARPSTLIWLRDAASRAAANRLIEILKRAPIDGLAEGPELASSVETALAGGTAADDETISTAWVRYVQALRKPVDGVSFGDPTLQLRAPTATAILVDALNAPSLEARMRGRPARA